MSEADARDDAHSGPTVDACQWRLRYEVGELTHFTEWTADFPTVENYYEQFRRADHVSAATIERREVLR
ncbi:hypothetical protein GOC74_12285 [Halomicrobium mukohataei]|uniref:Uncharacterized protein n=1 Tax=Halomicrobium mukohataei TaxID=57705 RepID=A0A847TXF9_9EURY|nr:hypothetical protein [Halomicrobium mukohataei]NLV10702.1 hypothetical protein [Halomicrobium mukohataei]